MLTINEIVTSEEALTIYRKLIIASILESIADDSKELAEEIDDKCQHLLGLIADAVMKEVPPGRAGIPTISVFDLAAELFLELDSSNAEVDVKLEFDGYSLNVYELGVTIHGIRHNFF